MVKSSFAKTCEGKLDELEGKLFALKGNHISGPINPNFNY